MVFRLIVVSAVVLYFSAAVFGQDNETDSSAAEKETEEVPAKVQRFGDQFEVAYQTSFSNIDEWKFVDDGWKSKAIENGKVLSLYRKKSNYQPKVRSPRHLALLESKTFDDFQLDVQIFSTHKDYNHRDVCLFFGYQSPTEFYYVHLGKKTDDHCNQIFIVNKADRKKISTRTTAGTKWDQQWHSVRVERETNSGAIRVYFDDMKTPVMTANDKTFASGKIGLGSFDDTAEFDNLTIRTSTVAAQKTTK